MAGTEVKRVLIIGCSDGIGLALVKRLLDEGWQVTGLSRRPSPVEHPRYRHRVQDVADTTFRARLAELVASQGPFSACVYCAGIGMGFDPASLDGDVSVFQVNLMAAVETAAVLIPGMVARRQGRFVVLSSLADRLILPESPAHAASKAGLSSYFEALALAVRASGVKVTNVRFGFVDTKMARSPIKPWLRSPEWAAAVVARALVDGPIRVSRPRRMGLLVAWLRWAMDWRVRWSGA